jgi:hypothetical protein
MAHRIVRRTASPSAVEQPVVTDPAADPVVTQRVVDPGAVSDASSVHVVSDPVVGERVVRQETVVAPSVAQSTQVVRRSWNAFSLSQVLHGLCGFVLVLLGAVAIARGGFDGNVGQQTTEVLGIKMTTVLGLVELAAGLLLLIAALTPSAKPFGGFIGVLLIVGGVVIIAGSQELLNDLHTEPALGWIALILGVISLVAAFLPEQVSARREYVAVR